MNKKQRIIALILGIVASGFIVSQSKVIQNQIQITKHHLKAYERGKTFTSVGLRLQFYDFAQKAIAEKPFFGQGTGAYHHLFAHGGRFKPGSPGQDDPHNQYLFIWFEQGLVGLLIWLTFLAYAFWNARKLGENKTLMQGLLIAFALGSMTDSYLFRSGSGFLFCSLLAIFYAKKTTESSSSQIAKTR